MNIRRYFWVAALSAAFLGPQKVDAFNIYIPDHFITDVNSEFGFVASDSRSFYDPREYGNAFLPAWFIKTHPGNMNYNIFYEGLFPLAPRINYCLRRKLIRRKRYILPFSEKKKKLIWSLDGLVGVDSCVFYGVRFLVHLSARAALFIGIHQPLRFSLLDILDLPLVAIGRSGSYGATIHLTKNLHVILSRKATCDVPGHVHKTLSLALASKTVMDSYEI